MNSGNPLYIEGVIGEMVRRIVTLCDPEQIILFGSHARGTAGPDSDVDFLVVMPLPSTKREARLKIRRALSGMGLSKDVIVVTPEEMDRFRQCAGTIVRAAVQEGKVLNERAA